MNCPLCEDAGGLLLWTQGDWRVVRVLDEQFPAYYRVIAQRHLAEFSQLLSAERHRCMELVCAIERVLVERLQPTKVNLAALGNMVPHLHWHVIARFEWDSHFPQPIWGTKQREVAPAALNRLPCSLQELDGAVVAALSAA
ncbi:MAG TPA: HIT family protein [Rhizobacter sp.]|jgi:diadenosine tetraphosphate (Ap4A) HIT family hydrolase|nr:HIT family protein [Rhizobacter sp.]